MPTTVRQLIVNAVKTRLQAINGSSPYETSIGANVEEWRVKPPEEAEATVVTFRDVDEQVSQRTSGVQEWRLKFEVEIWNFGQADQSTVRKQVADVYRALGQDRYWGGLAFDTEPSADTMELDLQTRVLRGALVTFFVKYRTKSWKPDEQQ